MRGELSVGEVAERTSVPVSTLHFYEAKGLIQGRRTDGNQRRYGRDVLRRVAIIKVAQRTGSSLAAIRDALATLPPDRVPGVADWRRLSESWRDELDERIARLERLRDRLDGCIGCGCLSLEHCPLRNPDDRLAQESPRRGHARALIVPTHGPRRVEWDRHDSLAPDVGSPHAGSSLGRCIQRNACAETRTERGKAPYVTGFKVADLHQLIGAAGFEIISTERHATKGKDARPYIVARKKS